MSHADTIAEIMPTLRGMATAFARDRHQADEIAQLAAIAVWQELCKAERQGRTVNTSYLQYRARWSMINALRGREVPTDPADLDTGEAGPDRSIAHHAPEIRAAVRDLTPRQREYVWFRFWRGFNRDDLHAAGFGNGVWYNADNGARAALRQSLAHLAGAA